MRGGQIPAVVPAVHSQSAKQPAGCASASRCHCCFHPRHRPVPQAHPAESVPAQSLSPRQCRRLSPTASTVLRKGIPCRDTSAKLAPTSLSSYAELTSQFNSHFVFLITIPQNLHCLRNSSGEMVSRPFNGSPTMTAESVTFKMAT